MKQRGDHHLFVLGLFADERRHRQEVRDVRDSRPFAVLAAVQIGREHERILESSGVRHLRPWSVALNRKFSRDALRGSPLHVVANPFTKNNGPRTTDNGPPRKRRRAGSRDRFGGSWSV